MVWDGSNIVRGDDGGVYQLSNPGGAAAATRQWTSLNGNLGITEFLSVAYDSNAKLIIGGAQDNDVPYQLTTDSETLALPSTKRSCSTGLAGDGTIEAVGNSANP